MFKSFKNGSADSARVAEAFWVSADNAGLSCLWHSPEVVGEYATGRSLRAGNRRRALSYKSCFRRKRGDEK
jgi:hypothetical protein